MVHSNSWTQVQTGQQGGEKEQSSLKQRLQECKVEDGLAGLPKQTIRRRQYKCGGAFGNLTQVVYLLLSW